jgi:H+-transporting ATPase
MATKTDPPKALKPKPVAKDDLQTLPLAEVEKRLDASPDGLTEEEAKKRLAHYGPNQIEEKRTNALLKFLSYFWGPIPWMIEIAVVLSAVVRHWPDFFIILLLLLANATIGFWEERQAGNAVDALKARLAIKARVRRDGKWVTPPAKNLVPGDAIRLRLGDIVPADARLLDGDEISVDQSALTGESLPATRKSGDAVFSGSIVRRGEIGALVYATGGKTYFGKTAELVETAVTVSHFQKAVLKIGDYLIMLAVVMVAVIVGLSIYRGEAVLSTLQFALVLTVAAIPVAMPTVLSVTMAIGARKLAKKQAIVSKLVAIEELAGVDVLCADKTGTLTQNKLTLGEPFCLDAVTPDDLILAGALASRRENDDTIDLAVLGGLKDKDALKRFQVTHFTPFDPVHKRTEATVTGPDGKEFKVTKGAPQVIQGLSANAGAVKSAVDKAVNDFAARGFRALGVARADGDGKWRLLGVLPLFDPPREDAKATIATAAKMGVKIKMVTGDALAIAREMAKTLGMGANILDGASLGDSKTDETPEIAKSIEDADGFAQVFPEHKFHIVDVLQKHDHIVGMTGDGVNDAPALKKADCGFAVSGATDAARAAASIVLVAPGLSVIIDAIKESREIFVRMNSYAMYRIAETLRVLIFMTLAIVVFNFFPVTAIMIVMLALLNDGAILSIAYDNVRSRDQPEAWDMRAVLTIATVLGIVGPIAAFGLFYLGDQVLHIDRPQLQTMMYLLLSVAGHLTIFQTRTRGPWWSIRPARILLLAVVGTQAVATAICLFGFLVTPLWWGWAALVWGYALTWFLVTDPLKLLAYRYLDATKKAAPKRQDDDVAGAAKNSVGDATGAGPGVEAATGHDAKAVEAKPSTTPLDAPAPKSAPAAEAEAEPTLADADPAKQRAALLDMKLSDVWRTAMARDPAGAGRAVGDTIVAIEAALVPGPTDKSPPPAASDAPPRTEPKAQPAATSESAPKSAPVPKEVATLLVADADWTKQRAALLDMKLSDVWRMAMTKDPTGAGRAIGDAIAAIEAALVPGPTDKSPPPAASDAPPRTDRRAQPAAMQESAPKSAQVAKEGAKLPVADADRTKQRAALLDMKLSDVWLTAMARDPGGAGRSFGDAIAEIETALVPGPTHTSPATGDAPPMSEPSAQSPAKPDPAPEATQDQTPRAAE